MYHLAAFDPIRAVLLAGICRDIGMSEADSVTAVKYVKKKTYTLTVSLYLFY